MGGVEIRWRLGETGLSRKHIAVFLTVSGFGNDLMNTLV